jgi:aspartate aminotransferase-like enzyme
MKGRIFRIAHIGLFDYMDTIAIIAALEQVAATSLSLPNFAFGKAVAAAQKVYAERTAQPAAQPAEALATV